MENQDKEKELDLLKLAKLWWNQKRILLYSALAGAFAGIVIAFSIPKEYLTSVQIAPEGQNQRSVGSAGMLAGLMGINMEGLNTFGLTSSVYPDIIKSTPFILEFADIPVEPKGLEPMTFYEYLSEHYKMPWWEKARAMPGKVARIFRKKRETPDTLSVFRPSGKQKRFTGRFKELVGVVEDSKKKDVITIDAMMQDPVVSAVIADSLISKLEKYMVMYRTEKARLDLKNSLKLLDEATERYYEADQKYAEAVDRNLNLTSSSAQVKIDRLRNEKDFAFSLFQSTATQVEANKIKLQEETPVITVIEPGSVPLRESTPNKTLIIAVFIVLAVFCCSGWIFVKDYMQDKEEATL